MSKAIRLIGYIADLALLGVGAYILVSPPSAAANYNVFAGCVILGAIIASAGHVAGNLVERNS